MRLSANCETNFIIRAGLALNDQATWNKRRDPKAGRHGADSPETAPAHRQTSSNMSHTQSSPPIDTIRTRCKKVPTQGVSDDGMRSLAARIAAIENIDLREEVLDVIVPFAAGDARAIVHSLWDVKLFALLDAEAARTHFGQSEASLAMELLEGAVAGIATSELLIISRRSLVSSSLLQTTIHALLHNIYTTQFLMLSERNAAFDAIEVGRKAAFSQIVKDHALAASIRLDRLWERLVHHWDPVPDLTKAALEIRVSRFRSMFEDMRIFEGQTSDWNLTNLHASFWRFPDYTRHLKSILVWSKSVLSGTPLPFLYKNMA